VNCLSWEKAEIRRFQAERFVFTAQVENKRYKIFQIVFGKSDGSLYVTFPYFDIEEGILSIGTIPAQFPTSQVNLESSGKVTSKQVKYAHHPDGEVHFSQTGQVSTSIRRKSLPLSKADGHLFSIYAQGFSHFEIDSTQDNLSPKMKRTVLNFNFGQEKPESIKMVARWYQAQSLIGRAQGNFFGPTVQGQTPNGRLTSTFLIGAPKGCPMEKYVLLVSCEAIARLDKDNEAVLNFIGGFDAPAKFNDITQAASFLCVTYPVANYEDLVHRIGSIDIIRTE
jgi:hypothetical protein